jgi:hypothetical protein
LQGIYTGQKRLQLTIAVAIPDIHRPVILSEDFVPYLAEIFELPGWRHLSNVSLNYANYFAGVSGITKVHPYRVPFRWRLIEAKEKHCPNDPYRAVGILINGVVDVLLANFMVCRSIGVVDLIELDAYSKD